MIYLKVMNYLKTTFVRPSGNFVWTQEKNDIFFKFLYDNFSKEEIVSKRNRSEIKQAFIDFLEPVGYILFRMNEVKIALRLFPYKIEPKQSKYLQPLKELVLQYKDLIKHDKDDEQLFIKGKLRRILYNFVDQQIDEQVHKKTLLKQAIYEALELNARDIILVKKKEVFIKKFKEKHKELERFNGLDENELKSLYDQYFDNQYMQEFLQGLADSIYQEYFLEKGISNEWYEKNIFSIVQEKIANSLDSFLETKDEGFRLGFAGFIFRVNFIPFFILLSEKILVSIYKRDELIISWLKYYDGHQFMDGTKHYKTQELIDKKNQRWNVVAIHAKVSIWFQAKNRRRSLKVRVHNLTIEMDSLLIDSKTPIEYKKDLLLKEEQLEKEIYIKKIQHKELVKELNSQEKKNEDILKSKIDHVSSEIQSLEQKISLFKKERFSIKTDTIYKEYKEEKTQAMREIERLEKVLRENKELFILIRSAVVHVLISKKILLSQ